MRKISVLITGASTGIGAACAVALAKKGHQVYAGVRKQKDGDALYNQCSGVQSLILDVCDSESVKAAFRKIKEEREIGREFCLVNNAGIAIAGPVECVTDEEFRRQFEVNVFGVHRVLQEFMPLIRETQGRVVQMSSISGKIASPFLGPYAASKFALEALSDSLRREVHSQGVKVILVEPGPVKTPIWAKSRTTNTQQLERMDQNKLQQYQPAVREFIERIDEVEKNAVPVEDAVRAVEKALLSPNPKLRYPVGSAKSASVLAKILPDSWLDAVLRKQFKL